MQHVTAATEFANSRRKILDVLSVLAVQDLCALKMLLLYCGCTVMLTRVHLPCLFTGSFEVVSEMLGARLTERSEDLAGQIVGQNLGAPAFINDVIDVVATLPQASILLRRLMYRICCTMSEPTRGNVATPPHLDSIIRRHNQASDNSLIDSQRPPPARPWWLPRCRAVACVFMHSTFPLETVPLLGLLLTCAR